MTATTRATDAYEYTATDGAVTLVRTIPVDGTPQSACLTVTGRGGDEMHVEACGRFPGHLDVEITEPGGRTTDLSLTAGAVDRVLAALAAPRADTVALADGTYRHPVALDDRRGRIVVDITTGADTSVVIIANHVAGVVMIPAADRDALHDALYTVAHVTGLDPDPVGPDHCNHPVDPTEDAAPWARDAHGLYIHPCGHPYGSTDVCPAHGRRAAR